MTDKDSTRAFTRTWAWAQERIWGHKHAPDLAGILLVIASHADNDTGESHPSRETIAAKMGRFKGKYPDNYRIRELAGKPKGNGAYVDRHIDTLVELGVLDKRQERIGSETRNFYTVRMDPVSQSRNRDTEPVSQSRNRDTEPVSQSRNREAHSPDIGKLTVPKSGPELDSLTKPIELDSSKRGSPQAAIDLEDHDDEDEQLHKEMLRHGWIPAERSDNLEAEQDWQECATFNVGEWIGGYQGTQEQQARGILATASYTPPEAVRIAVSALSKSA